MSLSLSRILPGNVFNSFKTLPNMFLRQPLIPTKIIERFGATQAHMLQQHFLVRKYTELSRPLNTPRSPLLFKELSNIGPKLGAQVPSDETEKNKIPNQTVYSSIDGDCNCLQLGNSNLSQKSNKNQTPVQSLEILLKAQKADVKGTGLFLVPDPEAGILEVKVVVVKDLTYQETSKRGITCQAYKWIAEKYLSYEQILQQLNGCPGYCINSNTNCKSMGGEGCKCYKRTGTCIYWPD